MFSYKVLHEQNIKELPFNSFVKRAVESPTNLTESDDYNLCLRVIFILGMESPGPGDRSV